MTHISTNPELTQKTTEDNVFLQIVKSENKTIQVMLKGTNKYKIIFQKEIAITPWEMEAKQIINNKSTNPKISNLMIVC